MNLNQRVKKIQASKLNMTERTKKELQDTIKKGNTISKETDKLLRNMLL